MGGVCPKKEERVISNNNTNIMDARMDVNDELMKLPVKSNSGVTKRWSTITGGFDVQGHANHHESDRKSLD